MITLAVDPGLRGCGVALFMPYLYAGVDGDPKLARAAYVPNPFKMGKGPDSWLAMARAVQKWLPIPATDIDSLVIEGQHIYGATKMGASAGADPNDLLELAGVAGCLYAILDPKVRQRVEPREWKGQISKVICQLRVNKRLSPEEAARIVLPPTRGDRPSELAHNVYDAIGIGLWAVGRWRDNATVQEGFRTVACGPD